jgi:hypothetical protein
VWIAPDRNGDNSICFLALKSVHTGYGFARAKPSQSLNVFGEEVRALEKIAKVRELTETARKILHDHQFIRNDVREGSGRCMLLQKLVLESQFENETFLA